MYASDGRMGELVALAHPEIRKDLADVIEKTAELYDILNVPALKEALLFNEQLTFQNMEKVARVLFDGDDLPHEAVQDILEKGYHVAGEHEQTRVVVESMVHLTSPLWQLANLVVHTLQKVSADWKFLSRYCHSQIWTSRVNAS